MKLCTICFVFQFSQIQKPLLAYTTSNYLISAPLILCQPMLNRQYFPEHKNAYCYVHLSWGVYQLFRFHYCSDKMIRECQLIIKTNQHISYCYMNGKTYISTEFVLTNDHNQLIDCVFWSLMNNACGHEFVTRLTQRVQLVEQELLSLPEHLNSPPVFVGFVLLDL